MAHLERNRVVRRQSVTVACAVLFYIIGIFSLPVRSTLAEADSAAAETISISGTKSWVDRNGNPLPEGSHPDSAELILYANGAETGKKEIRAADGWTWEFNDLPKYDENGEEISYSVRESSLDDYRSSSDMKISLVNTYSPEKEITVEKIWADSGDQAGVRPDSVTIRLLADGVPVDSMDLNEANGWFGTFSELPEMDSASENKITYTIEEINVAGYESEIEGNSEEGYTVTNTYNNAPLRFRMFSSSRPGSNREQEDFPGENTEQPASEENETPVQNEESESNEIETPQSGEENRNEVETAQTPESERPSLVRHPEPFSEIIELPRTGLTGMHSLSNSLNKAKMSYEPVGMELLIPSLNVNAEIVKVPAVNGTFPVEWLGTDAGLLAGTALPGEGVSVIAAHNTLNQDVYGPFAMLASLEPDERFFVRKPDGEMMIFAVYANEKIDPANVQALFQTASQYEQTITLLTCEDEMLAGGYASRRIVSARKIN